MKHNNNTNNFPIVCVGGSAGGLDAYIRLLKHLPNDMNIAIVIVNHLRQVATLLHEILPQYTEMPVELITEKLDIQTQPCFHYPREARLTRVRWRVSHKTNIKALGMARCDNCFYEIADRKLGWKTHCRYCFWL